MTDVRGVGTSCFKCSISSFSRRPVLVTQFLGIMDQSGTALQRVRTSRTILLLTSRLTGGTVPLDATGVQKTIQPSRAPAARPPLPLPSAQPVPPRRVVDSLEHTRQPGVAQARSANATCARGEPGTEARSPRKRFVRRGRRARRPLRAKLSGRLDGNRRRAALC